VSRETRCSYFSTVAQAGGAYDLYDFTCNGKLIASVAVDAEKGLAIL